MKFVQYTDTFRNEILFLTPSKERDIIFPYNENAPEPVSKTSNF